MSAPTKCEKCGATATYAIQVPCVMQCGGLMYYDHSAAALPDSGDAPRAEPTDLEMRNDNLRSELSGVYRDYDFLRAEFDEYIRTHPVGSAPDGLRASLEEVRMRVRADNVALGYHDDVIRGGTYLERERVERILAALGSAPRETPE